MLGSGLLRPFSKLDDSNSDNGNRREAIERIGKISFHGLLLNALPIDSPMDSFDDAR